MFKWMRLGAVWRWALGATVLILCAGFASAASAATIGGNGTGGPDCNGVGVLADSSYVVPAGGGTIVSFTFDSNALNAGQDLDFQVYRPQGGGQYQVVGETGTQFLAGTGTEQFPAAIAVQPGDLIGFYQDDIFNCSFTGSGTLVGAALAGSPGVGSTVTLPTQSTGHDLNLSATLVNFGITKTSSGGGSSATSTTGAGVQSQPLTYTLAYSNNSGGGTSSPGTTVQDTLPSGSQFVKASSGCSYSNSGTTAGTLNGQSTGGVVTCAAGTVADGGNGSFAINVLPRSTGTNTDNAAVSSGSAVVSPVATESDLIAAPTNSTCGTTPGTTFVGSISIASGTSCLINNTTVTGSINLHAGGGLVLTSSIVDGSVSSSKATVFTMCSDNVHGSEAVSDSTGRVVIGSDDGDCGVSAGNTIGASLSLSGNTGGLELFGNTIGGSVSVSGNTGGALGEMDIESNGIAGVLACTSNTPPPTDNGSANTAALKSGQCSTL
jgi:uncharacterized repeat protein (TIGR01451 family)